LLPLLLSPVVFLFLPGFEIPFSVFVPPRFFHFHLALGFVPALLLHFPHRLPTVFARFHYHLFYYFQNSHPAHFYHLLDTVDFLDLDLFDHHLLCYPDFYPGFTGVDAALTFF